MGNTCCSGDRGKSRDKRSSSLPPMPGRRVDSIDTVYDAKAHLREIQEFHLNRLRHELENDPHHFILDNLLLCIQFFDSFEKSVDSANEYRISAEREMTELLSQDPLEGMILGDRRIKLLTGMSHTLAQNYIYRGKHFKEDDEEIDGYYGGVGMKDTFMSEGILPLDFTISWDNFELHDPSELDTLKDYSDAKGASPIARFCMEQPDKRKEYPDGYVRLRCVDEPISVRKQLEIPPRASDGNISDFGYAQVYSDRITEVNSESDGAPSGATSEDDDDHIQFTEMVKSSSAIFPSKRPILSPTTGAKATPQFEMPSTSKGGLTQPHLALSKLNMIPQPTEVKNEPFPSLVVHAPTPPILDGLPKMSPFDNVFLSPQAHASRILNQHSRSTPNLSSISVRGSPGKDSPSSGYDTTSTMSRSSSMQSQLLRDKWQKQNLKRLWEYGKKSRKDRIPHNGKYDPVPQDCYSEIKYEASYDAPIQESDDDDEYDDDYNSEEDKDDDDDEDIDFSSGRLHNNKNRRKDLEDEYEMRFYLNSSQFSSNACSEFHYVGPTLTIPDMSLAHGAVLGTTIRCPIPFTYPKGIGDKEDEMASYYVTYTFTPSLHSKTLPKNLYFHFNQQIFNHKRRGEMWPSRKQMEQIELLGCNAVPLGYRPVEYFNPQQILEWELNFQDCETNLLGSFRHAQWRAYIFSSILFRAFIAPLGPQGVGLEHIRNILYCMCHDDFSGWNDEQPGQHLKTLLDNLFNALGRGYMPSFLIRSKNLLQTIPQQNLRFVQGHLNQIRENLTVYCIYAFRNLLDVRETKHSYQLPGFKDLYELLTVHDTELLAITSPLVRMQKAQEDQKNRELARQRARKKTRRQQKPRNLLDREDEIEKSFAATRKERMEMNRPPKRDKIHAKLHREYQKHLEKLAEEKLQVHKDREARKTKQDPEHRLPQEERRESIDLKKFPVILERFSPYRLLLVIQFFIKHFLDMAKKATDLENYAMATMYVFQVENLCDIVREERFHDVPSPFDEDDLHDYRVETLRLRGIIGNDMEQYILCKLTSSPVRHFAEPSTPNGLEMTSFPTFTNNWDLRKLPTPPPSEKDVPRPVAVKKLEKPYMVNSLQSFDSVPLPTAMSTPTPTTTTGASPKLPSNNKPRRTESIKFVESPKNTPPPTRSNSRPISRQQSTISISLEQLSDDHESTDL